MWMVVGLGNPGKKYARNRHNIGFMVLDMLVDKCSESAWREKFGGTMCSATLSEDKVVLLKPMEYMNNSGFAVARAAHFHQIESNHIIVIHDEIDLPLGRIRVKAGGGHGGHNGIRSIAEQLGSPDFLRVRVGVGKPTRDDGSAGEGEVSRHVLSDFSSEEQATVEEIIPTALEAVRTIVQRGVRTAMNEYNGLGKEPSREKQPNPDDD